MAIAFLSSVSCLPHSCPCFSHRQPSIAPDRFKRLSSLLLIASASANGAPFFRGSPQLHPEINSPRSSPAPEDALCAVPSCPVPDFSTSSRFVTLLNPCKLPLAPSDCEERGGRPLLVYVPGMDCTGQGIRHQLPHLLDAGYDVRCVYIPSNDRSSWAELVEMMVPLLKQEKGCGGNSCHVTLLGESFGGPLALRLALAAPNLISRLVLVNPATNFRRSSPFASFCSSTGLLALFPEQLYKAAQDILLPLMVNRDRVKKSDNLNMLSPVDLVPAACAAWRFSLLNDDTSLGDMDISSINIPTLVLSSAEDHVLSSVEEGGRLQRLLLNAKRIILPRRYGHVKATKLAAYKLLKEGERILLFPGGAREVYKQKGEQYKLMWKPTADFVRMASRFNTIIIPFGAIGGDDAFKILMDGKELLESPLGPLMQEVYGRLSISLDYINPLTAIPGTNIPSFLAIPSIERIYFHFAEPVDTAVFDDCSLEERHKFNMMYLVVKERVERSIDYLRQVRSNDEGKDLPKRLLGRVLPQLPAFNRA